MLPKLTDTTQTICFSEEDGVCSAEVFASEVVVTTTAGNHNHGSSMVKLKNVVDYNWELKFYPGQLLAVHMSGKYLAYAIKAPNPLSSGSCSGMVRVVYSPEPGTDRRALIKGIKGEIQDLAFAHIQNEAVLAFIDEFGNFYVHEIEVTDSGLRCKLIAEVAEETGVVASQHRVVWCPYIPDDDDAPDDNVARLLLTTHANIARMWNMSVCGGAARGAGQHAADILAAAFSPDGTALATAASDGYVMFFQVYMNSSNSPRCLHKWQPHGGKALSCLFFLDNHKTYNTDVQFWKFAVTGAENNTVIKIWSCKTWSCLQTIRLPQPEGVTGVKAALDASAGYLVVSSRRALYVLHVTRDELDAACCSSIAEFLLPYPVLSFAILDAEEETVKCESSCDDPYHRNGSADEDKSELDEFDLQNNEENGLENSCSSTNRRTRLRLYLVQPKGLQEGEIVYTPTPALPLQSVGEVVAESVREAGVSGILQQQTQQLKNLLMRTQTQPGSLMGPRAESPPAPLNLMTPDAFSSPGKRDEEDPPLSATPDITTVLVKPRTSTSGAVEEPAACPKLTSGGSSPSREVQEIMAHNDNHFFKDEMEEEESSQTPVAEQEPAPVENGAHDVFADSDVFADAEPAAPPLAVPPPPAAVPPPPAAVPPPPAAVPPPKLTHSNSETNWPQISIAQITEANNRKASSDKSVNQSSNQSVNQSGNQSVNQSSNQSIGDRASATPNNLVNTARLDALDHKLDKLCELLGNTRSEMRGLRSDVAALGSALAARDQRATSTLQDALADGWERAAAAGEAAARAAASAAGLGAARALEPLAAALQHELASKLSATDTLLRDNIAKLVSSKAVLESLSTAVSGRVSEAARASFRGALAELVLPAAERAAANLFRQLNHAFQQGTSEYLAATEAASRAAAERGGAAAARQLLAALQRHADALDQHLPKHLHQLIQETTHSVVEKEMSWWREQSLASRAASPATPASAVSAQTRQMQVAQIHSLMSSGDLNGAFQLALSASDLTLVMSACKAADPQTVFGPPCKLRQHVLLSLVQQLAADMSRDTALKHRYLEEAIMNLDRSSQVTREHLPVLVRELQKQIAGFLAASPQHALARQFRVLLMATDSLLAHSA